MVYEDGAASTHLVGTLSQAFVSQGVSPESILMQTVTWDDIGRSPIAGTYFVGDTNIVVRDADISVWREHPSAVFLTTWYKRGQMIGTKALADWTDPTAVISKPSAV